MVEPCFVGPEFENDSLSRILESVILLSVGEAIVVGSPLEAFEQISFFVEVELHFRSDANAELQTHAGFPFANDVGNDFKFRLRVDQNIEGSGAHIAFRGLIATFALSNPPVFRLLDDRNALGLFSAFRKFGGTAGVIELLHAEDFKNLVSSFDRCDACFQRWEAILRYFIEPDRDSGHCE